MTQRISDWLSPLRYPGGKTRLVPAIRQLIEQSGTRPGLLIEPFAGGASVSLGLLQSDTVDRVLIADLDPLVAAFWHQAAHNAEELIDAMWEEPVTLGRWDHWQATTPETQLGRAIKCLFLNRTSFSGIIGGSAGPIGGRAQASQYPIDCRFPKATLARRIRNIARLASQGRIAGVLQGPWQETLATAKHYSGQDGAVTYLDPPYVQKADRLYRRHFAEGDHEDLAHHLAGTNHRWILSYDTDPAVFDRYQGLAGVTAHSPTHTYTATGRRRAQATGREVLFTNLLSGAGEMRAVA